MRLVTIETREKSWSLQLYFLTIENSAPPIRCDKQLVFTIESWWTVDGHDYWLGWVRRGGPGWATTHRARAWGVSWNVARGRSSKQTFVIDLLWVFRHVFFHPCSRWTHSRMSVMCSVRLPALHAGLSACMRVGGQTPAMLCLGCYCAAATPGAKSIGIEYCHRITEKVSPIPISVLRTKSIDHKYSKSITLIVLVLIPILRY